MEMTDLPVHAPKAEIWRILRREKFENPFYDEHVALLEAFAGS
jgi:hypothetical protein